jgi:alkylation response protein AidB-like acyl-CoA dehydrogenase
MPKVVGKQYLSSLELERRLGDPMTPNNPMSFKSAIAADERDEYPEKACAFLEKWGFSRFFVPVEFGGKLETFEEAMSLIRVAARRDLTATIALANNLLGSLPVWISGDNQQKRRMAAVVLGGGQASLALTEKEHGSDILASEVVAVEKGEHYELSGQKWLIDNAKRCTLTVVFARTRLAESRETFSLFLFDKDRIAKSSYSYVPKVRTYGVRGLDLGGFRFRKCKLKRDDIIGSPGRGLDILFKAFQVSRPAISGLSLGAADTALRIALDFSLSRRLYRKKIVQIPHVQNILVDAFSDILICECVAISGMRSVQAMPDQMNVLSSVIKYFVPTTLESTIRNLAVLLGARHFLREGDYFGIFQKILRDSAIASVFEFSTVINLDAIVHSLDKLTRLEVSAEGRDRLDRAFCLSKELPPFAPESLKASSHGRNDVFHDLEFALDLAGETAKQRSIDSFVRDQLPLLGARVLEEAQGLRDSVEDVLKTDSGSLTSPELFELAKRYCALHAASACLHMWCYNDWDGFFGDGTWVVLCLKRILRNMNPQERFVLPQTLMSRSVNHLEACFRDKEPLSLLMV